MDGSVSGSANTPVYSFGTTQPSVHDVSSIARVLSGSGIANDDADEQMLTQAKDTERPSTHEYLLYPV